MGQKHDRMSLKCLRPFFVIFPVLISIQNDAGYAKWGPDAERVKKLVNAFRPTPRERHHSNGESSSIEV